MEDKKNLKIACSLINEFTNINFTDYKTYNDIKIFFHDFLSHSSINILYLVNAIENIYGIIPMSYLKKYDLCNLNDILSLISKLSNKGE